MATISNTSGSEGVATGEGVGTTTIRATLGPISGSTLPDGFTVGPAVLSSIDISPIAGSIANGYTLQYSATGNYTDGSSMDITILAAWSSNDSGIASFSGIPGEEGLATGESEGVTNITASLDGIDEVVSITITPAELVLIDVTPATGTVSAGLTLQYNAQGTYTDGSVLDITSSVTWTSSNNGIATINSTGLATGISAGTVNITASLDGIDDIVSLTIDNPISSDKDILTFEFLASENASLAVDTAGMVGASTVTAIVPTGTDISALVPNITISGVSISPADGDIVDFSSGPVTFIVTAEDSTTKNYEVSVVISGPGSWPMRLGWEDDDVARSIITDSSDNVIVTGFVTNDADLTGDGDTDDGILLEAPGGINIFDATDCFISKFDSNANFLWGKRIRGGGGANTKGYGMISDSSDSIIVVGSAIGSTDTSGDGVIDGEDAPFKGAGDGFFTKFDSNGNHVCAVMIGGYLTEGLRDVTVDSSDNIIVTGYVEGSADFNDDGDFSDPQEPAVYSSATGNYDIVVAKYDSNCNYLWGKRYGGHSDDLGRSITVDLSDNIIITGEVGGKADVDGDGDFDDGGAENSTGYGVIDILLTKVNSNGVHQWSKRLGGKKFDRGTSVTTDSNNNIILTGSVTGSADLNGDGDQKDGPIETTGIGPRDAVIVKFDASGSYLWAKRIGGTVDNNEGYGITVDSLDNIITSGYVAGDADLNDDGDQMDTGEDSTGFGDFDVYLSKFYPDGTSIWTKRIGGTTTDFAYSVAIDSMGRIIIAGETFGDADLNGDGDMLDSGENSTGYGPADAFISIFDMDGVPVE